MWSWSCDDRLVFSLVHSILMGVLGTTGCVDASNGLNEKRRLILSCFVAIMVEFCLWSGVSEMTSSFFTIAPIDEDMMTPLPRLARRRCRCRCSSVLLGVFRGVDLLGDLVAGERIFKLI